MRFYLCHSLPLTRNVMELFQAYLSLHYGNKGRLNLE